MTEKTGELIAEARNSFKATNASANLIHRLADALEAATSERAAVPDAATELALKKAEAFDKTVALSERRQTLLEEAEAERDAALAAVERVRAVLFKRYTGSPGFEDTPEHVKEIDALRDLYGEELADDLLAALDGAPEPEGRWEYGYELIEPNDRNVFDRDGDYVSAAFAYRAAMKRIHEERHPDVPNLQYTIVRRRKAGPWEACNE